MRASMTPAICADRQVCRASCSRDGSSPRSPRRFQSVRSDPGPNGAAAGPEIRAGPPVGVADTEFVSLGAVVQYVGEVLGRAHSLFGDPPDSGGAAAGSAGGSLSGAGQVVRTSQGRVSGMAGDFVSTYAGFTGKAAPALDTLAGLDDRLGGTLTEAAGADRNGRGQSGAVVNGAASDTNTLAPWTGTPAGQKALLTQLRGRLAQQQQVLQAYKTRDARMAALLRSMMYQSRMGGGGGGGMPFSPAGFGGLGGGGSAGGGLGSMPGLSGLSGLASAPITLARGRPPSWHGRLAARGRAPRCAQCAAGPGRRGGGGCVEPSRHPVCVGG